MSLHKRHYKVDNFERDDLLEWQNKALCADSELFIRNGYGFTEAARRICRRCVVMEECLDDVLKIPEDEDEEGVRGGTSTGERKKLRSLIKQSDTQEKPIDLLKKL